MKRLFLWTKKGGTGRVIPSDTNPTGLEEDPFTPAGGRLDEVKEWTKGWSVIREWEFGYLVRVWAVDEYGLYMIREWLKTQDPSWVHEIGEPLDPKLWPGRALSEVRRIVEKGAHLED